MHSLTDDTYFDLLDAMSASITDESVAAFVLASSGRFFSSGNDLSSFGRSTDEPPKQQPSPASRFMYALIEYPKLLACAVQGPAVGIATTMLPHFDLVFASSRATFWTPFTRIAVVPEMCSSVTFRELMGVSKANELLLLGRTIDAKTAYEWNMISRVIPEPIPTTKSNPLWLAEKLCSTLDENLLSLPLGDRTASYFVKLVRSSGRKEYLANICRTELKQLEERFLSGQVLWAFAATQLQMKQKKGKTRSRL